MQFCPDALPRRRATGSSRSAFATATRRTTTKSFAREARRNFWRVREYNARSLQFAVVIYVVIRPLSSTRLRVYCICRRCFIARHDDNAIRDADATLTKATSRCAICTLFALYSTVNVNLIFTMHLIVRRITLQNDTLRQRKTEIWFCDSNKLCFGMQIP